MRSPIDIHEFSTGINFQLIGNSGKWVSRGFTGQYMNNTLAQQGISIPPEVEQAIADRKFAVSEGAYTKEPAMIARDLPNSPWSVIAVVSRGEDEKGRSASFYRFFLCQKPPGGYQPNEDGISILLTWMTDQKNKSNTRQWPHFHPQQLEREIAYQPNKIHAAMSGALSEKHALVEGTQPPYIWRANTGCVPLVLHGLAKQRKGSSPLAWAFNAGALENPWSFTIIYPADAKAEELIQRAIINPPTVRVSGPTSEQALNMAIKTLTTMSTVRADAVKILFSTAASGKVPPEVWIDLFDKRGVKKAIDHSFSNPEMVKLMTLRALLAPSTLMQFLNWIGLLAERKKPTESEKVSVDFQKGLSVALAEVHLADSVEQSIDQNIVEVLMPELLRGSLTSDDAYRILSIRASLWGKRFPYFLRFFEKSIKDINENIPNIRQNRGGRPHEGSLWQGIYAFRGLASYSSRDERDSYYNPLASLLIKVGNGSPFTDDTRTLAYKLAAYLSQMSGGSVNSPLYKAAFPDAYTDNIRYLSEDIQRNIPLKEEIISALGSFLNMQMRVWQVLIVSSITFAIGIASGVVGTKYSGAILQKVQGQARSTNGSNSSDAAGQPPSFNQASAASSRGENSPQDEEMIKGLQDIVVRLSDEFKETSQDIVAAQLFEKILKADNSIVSYDYSIFITDQNYAQKKTELVRVLEVYKTELENSSASDGNQITVTPEDVLQTIEEEVRELLNEQSQFAP